MRCRLIQSLGNVLSHIRSVPSTNDDGERSPTDRVLGGRFRHDALARSGTRSKDLIASSRAHVRGGCSSASARGDARTQQCPASGRPTIRAIGVFRGG